MAKRRVAILGSTGSIGTQTLEVIRQQSDLLEVSLLVAQNSWEKLVAQAMEFNPDTVVISNPYYYDKVKIALNHLPIKVFTSPEAVNQSIQSDDIDIVITAMVGFVGLSSTIEAIKSNKIIGLANKETLVVAGQYIKELSKEHKARIIPVDSEHSALYQCLVGEDAQSVSKLILTASGGPFRGKNKDFLKNVTLKEALNHPNWTMGRKITIDSATLMNKGLEIIEAKWLFDVEPSQIEVVVHPQSIIHSMVEFKDGSIKAQLGLPDMKLPIQYALTYPLRVESHFEKFSFIKHPQLTFESPDLETFECLSIALESMHKGGNAPCIMNAANEVAVEAFLQEKISFLQIAETIKSAIQKVEHINTPTLEDYFKTDLETRNITKELVKL